MDGREVKRARYDYYITGDAHGPAKTLSRATVEEVNSIGLWTSIREQRYRYYKTTGGGELLYGIKLMFSSNGVTEARDRGFDLDTASDEALAPYASHRFTYDMGGRVTSETIRGGEAFYEFAWLTSATEHSFSESNTWYRRCIDTRPDGTTFTVYTNRGGLTILSILTEAGSGDKWYEYNQYNSENYLTLRASSAAVATVSEPANNAGSLTVTLHADAGLISVNTYYAADDFPDGEVTGYLATSGVKEGSGGTVSITRRRRYDTRTVGGITIHPIREETLFPVAGADEEDAARTVYARTWHLNAESQPTFQVAQLTVTPPLVPEIQHGTDESESVVAIYDIEGFLIWERDARGVITWHAYDRTTGAEIQRIMDADPALLPSPPSGWVAPSFGGTHLVFDFVADALGRTTRVIEPEHFALVDGKSFEPCQPSDVRAVPVRRVSEVLYLDSRLQTWSGQGYVTGFGTAEASWHVLGPITIEQRDPDGRVVDSVQARPSCSCGALSLDSFGVLTSPGGLPDRSLWTRWTHLLLDLWGRETGRRDYTLIPLEAQSIGFEGENYWLTQRGYDSMNRANRLVTADGTITRTVFDVRDLPDSIWIGTNDNGATDTDPANGGADGNNLKAIEENIYDDGDPGLNGNLTERRLPVDDEPAHDRVSQYFYDFRDRVIRTESNDGTRLFLTVSEYNNLDQALSVTSYHTAVSGGNRIARSETAWDLRNRVFEKLTWGVDPATGNLTEALAAGTWYDPNSNIIVQSQFGSGQVTKIEYDALNRPVRVAQVVPGTPP